MSKMKTWLSALLVAQIALAVGLYWNSQNELKKSLPKPLVAIDWQKLDHIVIADDKRHVTVAKTGDRWVLPEHGGIPTIEGNAQTLIDKLQSLKTGWPVASTSSSHSRFSVTDSTAERTVDFYQGDKLLGKLIVGTTPGLRKRHVRMGDDDNVYSVNLELTDMITFDQAWFDRSLLTAAGLERIQGSDYLLEKNGEDWQLSSIEKPVTHPEVNSGKVGDLVYSLKALEVRKLVPEAPDLTGSGYAQLTVQLAGSNKPLTYQFYSTKERCYVTRSDYEAMFTIGWEDYEKIAEVTLEKLSILPSSEESTATSADGNSTD